MEGSGRGIGRIARHSSITGSSRPWPPACGLVGSPRTHIHICMDWIQIPRQRNNISHVNPSPAGLDPRGNGTFLRCGEQGLNVPLSARDKTHKREVTGRFPTDVHLHP